MSTLYRGRFAPSPTGPLHFGSLVAAVASYLRARAHGGVWLVRIEDIDPPREVEGASDAILRALEAFGLVADEPVVYQSRRRRAYDEALARLATSDALYGCNCSRREIADSSALGIDGPVYPGTCRNAAIAPNAGRSARVRTEDLTIVVDDLWQGRIERHLERDYGDFVVRRGDGQVAYQLACVVDDAAQGVTEVVRGADLLESTPRQIYLQRLLGLPTPAYAHLPVATDVTGDKLSKQTHAAPIDETHPVPTLVRALAFLGQQPPPELHDGDLTSTWRWAQESWRPDRVPRTRARSCIGATANPIS